MRGDHRSEVVHPAAHGLVRDRDPALVMLFSYPASKAPASCPRRDNARRTACSSFLAGPAQADCRNVKPAGISPTVTMRQNAMSSFRASATIIFVFRAAAGPFVRARYHWASALPFWNRRKRQASWVKPRLTRALPDFANPSLAGNRSQ
jgi:hypothetical protein